MSGLMSDKSTGLPQLDDAEIEKKREDYTQLRALLVSSETERLQRLEKRLTDIHQRSRDVAEALPLAVADVTHQAQLTASLQTPVEQCVQTSLKNNPQPFAKAIMPVLAPSLRKTIAEAFKSIREFSNELQLRLEALEKGVDDLKQGQLSELLRRLSYIEKNMAYLTDLENRLNELETEQLSQLTQQLDALEEKQIRPLLEESNQHDQRLSYIEKNMAHLTELENRLNALETERLSQLMQQLKALEEKQVRPLLEKFSQHDRMLLQLKGINQQVAQLRQLQSFFTDPQVRIDDMAKLLPQVLRQAVDSQRKANKASEGIKEDELVDALRAPVEQCIKDSIEHDAPSFANALFPVMGPSIRKSINEAFKSLLQSINKTLEQSLSARGLMWRVEALKTGRPYSDIVLQKTFVYRVEQIFLIHRETGLLVQHMNQDNVDIGDSDAISAMLTAIQDFIRDSFSASKTEELDSAEVGDYTVWLDRSPHVILACVIRGSAPYSFRQTMRSILEKVEARYGRQLTHFSGEQESFEPSKPLLEKALEAEKKDKFKENRLLSPISLLIFSAIGFLLVSWIYQTWTHASLVTQYVDTLEQTPGIVLISAKDVSGQLILRGLRDPLSYDPRQLAKDMGIEDEIVADWTPYQSLVPTFMADRLKKVLKPPDTVKIEVEDERLIVEGHAEQTWIDKFNEYVNFMAGLSDIVSDQLVDTNAFWTKTEVEFQHYVKSLASTLGIVVISTNIEGDKRVITGLRDPLAEAPSEIAARINLSQDVRDHLVMRWRSYQDLTPEFIEKRVALRLNPPETIGLKVEDSTLYLTGHAPQTWIDNVLATSTTITGIQAINDEQLQTTDDYLLNYAQQHLTPSQTVNLSVVDSVLHVVGYGNTEEIKTLTSELNTLTGFDNIDTTHLVDAEKSVATIEGMTILFEDDDELTKEQQDALISLAETAKQLLSAKQDIELHITGYTDGLGTRIYNEYLSRQRGKAMYDWLVSQGIDSQYLRIVPPEKIRFGEKEPDFGERRVKITIVPQTSQPQ